VPVGGVRLAPRPKVGLVRAALALLVLAALAAALPASADAAKRCKHRHHKRTHCHKVRKPKKPAPPSGDQSTTRPANGPILSDADAAAHVKLGGFEPRADNAAANQRVPTADEIAAFRAASDNPYRDHVTGAFTGTTDELIQWAAWKWGLDEDMVRAEAAQESWWHENAVGDNGESFGLMQIRAKYHPGTFPLSRESTAFNLDYYGAVIRSYYDGHETWLNTVEHGQPYAAGDIWGAIGAWFAGRWHTGPADQYIAKVRALQAQRIWAQPDFQNG
jgi:hypothetical protein